MLSESITATMSSRGGMRAVSKTHGGSTSLSHTLAFCLVPSALHFIFSSFLCCDLCVCFKREKGDFGESALVCVCAYTVLPHSPILFVPFVFRGKFISTVDWRKKGSVGVSGRAFSLTRTHIESPSLLLHFFTSVEKREKRKKSKEGEINFKKK